MIMTIQRFYLPIVGKTDSIIITIIMIMKVMKMKMYRDRCCQNYLHCGDREQKADQSELGR